MKLLSIIVPCFNEEQTIMLFYHEIKKVMLPSDMDFEILFVDDGSSDGTINLIKELAKKDACVKYLSFARNFGKESAMYAGLCNAKGDYVTVMDADLQDPPSLLPKMIAMLESGEYDSVATRRIDRKGDPQIRSWFAKGFYRLFNKCSDMKIVEGARDYRLMSRQMVDAVIAMGEYNRFSKGIYAWVGFRTYWMTYENAPRAVGDTKWGFWKLMRYAFDSITNFSDAPLKVASLIGSMMAIFSFFAMIFIVVRKLMYGDPVSGWASTICIMVFIGGIQLAVLGLIGEYVAKTYMETKNRPHFIVADSNIEDLRKIR